MIDHRGQGTKIRGNKGACPLDRYTQPPPLVEGDKVGIFVPASPVKEPYRSNGVKKVQELGYVPVETGYVLCKLSPGDFLAQGPAESFKDIQRFFKAKEIKALWAGRGGYGSNHLLPLLPQLDIPEPKVVIGSSDVSYLLWYLLDHFKMVVFYGPMVYSSLAENRFDRGNLKDLLNGNYQEIKIPGKILIPGKTKGIVTGGCLSNFVSLIGTPYLPEVEQRVLLLEDVGERPYRLDRMFWQVAHAGIFSKIKGLILGEFPRCFNDNKGKENFEQRVKNYLKDYQVPVISDLPFGHSENIHTLPLGVTIEIDTVHFEGLIIFPVNE
jgi:muramoyltetrapeptide carboxypeptidase